MKPSLIYSSPKKRTLQTAQIIADICNIGDVYESNLLLEYDKGEWSSMPSSELQKTISKKGGWVSGRPAFDWHPPRGESWQDLQLRAKRVINNLKEAHQDTDVIVVVSHNQFIRAIRGVALDLSFNLWFDYKPTNAEVLEIDI